MQNRRGSTSNPAVMSIHTHTHTHTHTTNTHTHTDTQNTRTHTDTENTATHTDTEPQENTRTHTDTEHTQRTRGHTQDRHHTHNTHTHTTPTHGKPAGRLISHYINPTKAHSCSIQGKDKLQSGSLSLSHTFHLHFFTAFKYANPKKVMQAIPVLLQSSTTHALSQTLLSSKNESANSNVCF